MKFLLVFVHLVFILVTVSGQDKKDSVYSIYLKDKEKFQSFEATHRKFIQTRNHKISYLQWGENTDKIFVWLPGSLLSAYDFYPFAEHLQRNGYCVLSIDHYGHGLTEIPKKDLDFWDFSDDLAYLLNTMKPKETVFSGFSRGAYIATAFYQKYPNMVNALILEEGGTVAFKRLFDAMGTAGLNKFLSTIKLPDEFKKLLFDEYDSEFEIYKNLSIYNDPNMQWQSFGSIKKKGNSWIFYNGLNEYMNMEDSVKYSQILFSPDLVSLYASSIIRVDPIKVYSDLKIPMLIIETKGKQDLFDSTLGNIELKKMHPGLIEYKVFDCDSHNVHYGCPQNFIDEISRFLKIYQ